MEVDEGGGHGRAMVLPRMDGTLLRGDGDVRVSGQSRRPPGTCERRAEQRDRRRGDERHGDLGLLRRAAQAAPELAVGDTQLLRGARPREVASGQLGDRLERLRIGGAPAAAEEAAATS